MPKDHKRNYLGTCDLCGEPVQMDEAHYEMPDGDFICEECASEWLAQYYVMGVIDLAGDP